MIIAPGVTRKPPSYWLEKVISPVNGLPVQVGSKYYMINRNYGPVDIYTFDFADESYVKIVNQGGGGAAPGTGNYMAEAVGYGTSIYMARGTSGYWVDGLFSIFNTLDNTFYNATIGYACGDFRLVALPTNGMSVVVSIAGSPSSPNAQIPDASPFARFYVYPLATPGAATPSAGYTIVNFKNTTNNDMEFVANDTKFYSLCGQPAENNYYYSIAVYNTSTWTFVKYITSNKYYFMNNLKNVSTSKAYLLGYYLPNGNWSVYTYGMIALNTTTDTVSNFIPFTTYTPSDLKRSVITLDGSVYVPGYTTVGGNWGLIKIDTATDQFVDFLPSGANNQIFRPALYSSTNTLYAGNNNNAVATYKKDYPTSTADRLLHFEGAAGTITRLIENGKNSQTWGINGSPTYSTTNYKFGTSSMDCSAGYVNSYYYLQPPTFTSGVSFNFECWIRPSGTSSTTGTILSLVPNSTSYGPFVIVQNGSTLTIKVADDVLSTWTTTSAGTLVANTWQHLAVSADGTTLRVFLDGTMIFSVDEPGWSSSSQNINVGGLGTAYFQGCIDEFRGVNDVALYTANFTPSTQVFT